MLLYRAVVRIDAPPERVWDWLRDWDRSSRWILGTTVEVVGAQREGIGARTRAMTVTRWDPPRLLEVRHHKRPVLGDAWFEVVPDGAGARVEWVEDLELPFGRVGELVGSLARAPVEWGLRKSLVNLKSVIERAG